MIKQKNDSRRADDADKNMFDAEDPVALAKAVKQGRQQDKGSRRAKKENAQMNRAFERITKNF